jgi:hypothetical protein
MDWFDEIQPEKEQRKVTEHTTELTGGVWDSLWLSKHPEGGGPFNGRDNALTRLVGFFRAKRFPFNVAVLQAHWWNNSQCDPPLEPHIVEDKVKRAWALWIDGGIPDLEPDDLIPARVKANPLRVLSWNQILDEVAEMGEMQWLVKDVIIKGGIHFITAPPAGGKSWAAIDLVTSATYGGKWLGTLPIDKLNVMYIDEEMGVQQFHSRVSLLGSMPENLHYMPRVGVRLDNKEHVKFILNYVKEKAIDVVILDTLVRVHGYDENSNTEMAKLFAVFKQIAEQGASVVCLHHHRKGTHTGSVAHEQMRGAGEIAAQADLVASIEKHDGMYTFTTTKQRHVAEDEWVKFNFSIVKDGEILSIRGTTHTSQEAPERPMRNQIVNLLCDMSEAGTNTITAKIKGRKETVRKEIQSLLDDGIITFTLGDNNTKLWRMIEL